jgi:hypothetical protein
MASPEEIAALPITFLQRPGRVWLWLSIAAASLAAIGSLAGVLTPSIYSALTAAFLPQAFAQDLANLVLVSPAMLLLAALSLRGSLRAYLLWLGVVIFTIYNYVIYTFSIPFGPLFFLWVAVLGLSIYALIGGVASARHEPIRAQFRSATRTRVVAWVLIVLAVLFGFLWLSEDVPALLTGAMPASVTDMGLPTNPVHVLDLAFFLPAVVLTGAMLLRRVPLGYTLSLGLIVFLILTGVPILLTPVVQTVIGQTPAWGVALPIGTITVLLVILLAWLMASIREQD